MGSTGSGSFSDYSGSRKGDKNSQGSGGGSSGIDKCRQAFSTNLEEVAQCAYYVQSKGVPPPGSELSIVFDRRLFAVDSTGVRVGALPTSFNYLAACLASGITYVGVVKSSSVVPMPLVEVDFIAK